MGNDHAIVVDEDLADAGPLQIVFDFLRCETKPAVILCHSDGGVEGGATLHLSNPQSSQEISPREEEGANGDEQEAWPKRGPDGIEPMLKRVGVDDDGNDRGK